MIDKEMVNLLQRCGFTVEEMTKMMKFVAFRLGITIADVPENLGDDEETDKHNGLALHP